MPSQSLMDNDPWFLMFLWVRNSGEAQLASTVWSSHDSAVKCHQECFIQNLDGGCRTQSKLVHSHNWPVGAGLWPVLHRVICMDNTVLSSTSWWYGTWLSPERANRGTKATIPLNDLPSKVTLSLLWSSIDHMGHPWFCAGRLGSQGHHEDWLLGTFSALCVTYAEKSKEERAGWSSGVSKR